MTTPEPSQTGRTAWTQTDPFCTVACSSGGVTCVIYGNMSGAKAQRFLKESSESPNQPDSEIPVGSAFSMSDDHLYGGMPVLERRDHIPYRSTLNVHKLEPSNEVMIYSTNPNPICCHASLQPFAPPINPHCKITNYYFDSGPLSTNFYPITGSPSSETQSLVTNLYPLTHFPSMGLLPPPTKSCLAISAPSHEKTKLEDIEKSVDGYDQYLQETFTHGLRIFLKQLQSKYPKLMILNQFDEMQV